ncbi:MAG: retroviral-like aspartic protease family protein [Chloroflexi bacterium]|nr:retroviral-like aspartic protease family protein [Chloroflexota bacterium]
MSEYIQTDYALPIPVLHVSIGNSDDTPWLGPLDGIVDTGADITMIPLNIIARVNAPSLQEGYLRSAWGSDSRITFFIVNLQIEQLRFSGVQVASNESIDEIILGRNVLNKLPLFLDGPKQQTEILDDATAKRLRDRRG